MLIIGKISLTATLILMISVVASIFGILDNRYVKMIMYAVFVVQTMLLIIVIIILILKKRKMKGVRIIRYQLQNQPVKGETNIISEKISPTNPMKSTLFKIFLEIDNISEPPEIGIGIYKITTEKIIPDIKNHVVNINSGMVDHSFIFDADVIVRPEEQINFQVKKDTTIKLFFLGEFYVP